MRFLLYDRVTRLVPGERIEGVKCVSLTEEFLRGHFPRRPLVPGTMLVEAMVQLLGWLVVATHEFRLSPLFSLVEDVDLPCDLGPGHRVDLVGELVTTNPVGSMGRARAIVEGRTVASVGRVLYGHYAVSAPSLLRERFLYYGGIDAGGGA